MTIIVPEDKPHLKEAIEEVLEFLRDEPEAEEIIASGDVVAITKWIHQAETPQQRERRKVMSFGARWGSAPSAPGDYKAPTAEEAKALMGRWKDARNWKGVPNG